MLDLPGYAYRETVFQGTRHTALRCVRERDGRPVVVKIPRADHPSLEVNAALKHEFEIARRLQDERILAALDLEPTRNGYALVTEDFGGLSLAQWLPGNPLSLEAFLHLAIRLTDILSFVHGAGVIHKDIKISNFIVSPDLSRVKLTDFGIAAVLPREHSQISATDVIEGTLAYMSPEQTGRMNRSLDQRSDLYSLGVTLCRLLTGRLPFTSEDPQKLYGRDDEVRDLMAAFERTANGAVELVLVSGYSGIGKSALVGEVSRPITLPRHRA